MKNPPITAVTSKNILSTNNTKGNIHGNTQTIEIDNNIISGNQTQKVIPTPIYIAKIADRNIKKNGHNPAEIVIIQIHI